MAARLKPAPPPETPTTDDLNWELVRLSQILERATEDYHVAALQYAQDESAYRQAQAISYLAAVTNDKKRPKKEWRTIPALEATRDIECQEERERAYIARANKEAHRERVLSLRAQLSALQSVASSLRAELELAGKGPR